jgi:hypothetical protein
MVAACCHQRSQEHSVFERRAFDDEERFENPSLSLKISNFENRKAVVLRVQEKFGDTTPGIVGDEDAADSWFQAFPEGRPF